MKMNELSQEELDTFCRELGELLMKHKVSLSPCEACGAIELYGTDDPITCGIGSNEHHEQYLWID